MRPISEDVKNGLQKETACILCGNKQFQFHHAIEFGGRQLDKAWAILPLCNEHHAQCTRHNSKYRRYMADKVLYLALKRATIEELEEISKVIDYKKKLAILSRVYDNTQNRGILP